MKIRAAAFLILGGLVLTGCKVGPDFTAPKPALPGDWVGTSQPSPPAGVAPRAGDLRRWWTRLQDPTLDGLVEAALKANLSMASAEASLRQARAVRGIAAGGLWPSVTATAAVQRQQGPQYRTGGGAATLFQAGLDATWELDLFGGVRRGVESADAEVLAAQENLWDVQVSITAEVALDYIQLRGYQQQIVTARNNLEIQQHTVDITRKLYQVGFDSGLDLANAQSTLASTEAQIPVYETGARQSIYALSVLLAQPPGYLLERLSPTADLPVLSGEIPAGLPSDLVRRRPDIRMAEAQLHSATAQIGVAVAQLFPQFSLTGDLGWVSTQSGAWLKKSSRSFSVGPTASWSIFQGGAAVSNIRQQEALRDNALIAYQQSVLGALQDVENALTALGGEQAHCRSLGAAVAADHKAVDLSLKLFREGQTDFLTVITAQRTLYADDSALAQSRQNLGTDLVALFKALGGGWDPES